MRTPDLDKARSEKTHSLAEFMKLYNENLPAVFPRASIALLKEFQSTHGDTVKSGVWSLDQHRKKVMDWLTARPV